VFIHLLCLPSNSYSPDQRPAGSFLYHYESGPEYQPEAYFLLLWQKALDGNTTDIYEIEYSIPDAYLEELLWVCGRYAQRLRAIYFATPPWQLMPTFSLEDDRLWREFSSRFISRLFQPPHTKTRTFKFSIELPPVIPTNWPGYVPSLPPPTPSNPLLPSFREFLKTCNMSVHEANFAHPSTPKTLRQGEICSQCGAVGVPFWQSAEGYKVCVGCHMSKQPRH